VVILEVVVTFRSEANPKGTRTKEEALRVARSVRADMLAGKPAADLLAFTDVRGRDMKPFQDGRFRLTRKSAVAPPLLDAAFATRVGEVGPEPIETDIGWVVFRREE
jgi:hypothetical protein